MALGVGPNQPVDFIGILSKIRPGMALGVGPNQPVDFIGLLSKIRPLQLLKELLLTSKLQI
jgi:hypothetical protein